MVVTPVLTRGIFRIDKAMAFPIASLKVDSASALLPIRNLYSDSRKALRLGPDKSTRCVGESLSNVQFLRGGGSWTVQR